MIVLRVGDLRAMLNECSARRQLGEKAVLQLRTSGGESRARAGSRLGYKVHGDRVAAPMRSSAARAAHRDARPLLHLFRANESCESTAARLGACLKAVAASVTSAGSDVYLPGHLVGPEPHRIPLFLIRPSEPSCIFAAANALGSYSFQPREVNPWLISATCPSTATVRA